MNPFKRGDFIHFQNERYEVKFVDGLDLFVQNEFRRLRLDYRTVSGDF